MEQDRKNKEMREAGSEQKKGMVKSSLKTAAAVLAFMTVVGGLAYPLGMTAVSQAVFPDKANGSVIEAGGKQYGSALLAQSFSPENDPEGRYLWGRAMNISAFAVSGENGEALLYSGPSNLSPASEAYETLVSERVEAIRSVYAEKADEPVPADLVTVSGSGLDPEISPEAAAWQAEHIARVRNLSVEEVQSVIDAYTTKPFLGVFGEPAVNVLKVNLTLDGILPRA